MTTAELIEIVRQRNEKLKQTVTDLSVGKIGEAVADMDSRGKVIEIEDEPRSDSHKLL
jgi:hypothetical protein